MNIIAGPRGIGKTSELIYFAKENDAILLCKDPQKMHEKGWKLQAHVDCKPYSWAIDFNAQISNGQANQKFVIDDIDEFLNVISQGRCLGGTLTKEV